MIAELTVGEVIFRGNGEPCPVQRIQPRFGVFSRNFQRAISEWLRAAVQLLQVRGHGLGGGTKQAPQLRFDIDLPFRANLLLRSRGRRAEDSLLGGFDSLDVAALGNLSQSLGQEWI